jgi:hypothetical protein
MVLSVKSDINQGNIAYQHYINCHEFPYFYHIDAEFNNKKVTQPLGA